ncbi:amino acid ABC transporter permease [Candidatus Bipolaricaulota sp. J31]
MVSFWELFRDSLPVLLAGVEVTVELTAICIAAGFVLGWLLALGRIYGGRVAFAVCTGYIEFVRGTPLLVQLFFLYYGLPDVGVVLPPLLAAGIAMGLNTAAYQAEYFRGAIRSIPRGQVEAAYALGMSRLQAFRYIVFPQAMRIVMPAWSNELIYMLKYSSLAFVVGVPELMGRANLLAARNFRYFELYLIVAAIYVCLVWIVGGSLSLLERRLKVEEFRS